MSQSGAPAVSREQLLYASVLDWGTRVGLLILVVSFAAHLLGILPSHVPFEDLPKLWHRPVATFLHETGMPTGWGWLSLVHKGDVLCLVGIAILSGCSAFCLLALAGVYARKGDRVYLAIAVLEVAVLVLAASGILTAGH